MTGETALVKLMWALRQPGDVASLMRTNIAERALTGVGAWRVHRVRPMKRSMPMSGSHMRRCAARM
jgi:hypothetical protein